MSDANNKEFFSLLDKVVENQSLQISNSDGNHYNFKALTTAQLKQIVQTVVDTSSTQASFHSAVYEVMKQNFADPGRSVNSFNILDKLLFIIETRINAVSPTLFIRGNDNNSFIPTDLNEVKAKLEELISMNQEQLADKIVGNDNIKVHVGIPLIETEQQVNKEIYSKLDLKSEDPQVLQEVLGTAFLIEISKWIKQITVLDQVLDLADVKLDEKLEAIEKIPASVIEKAIEYIETTKQKIDNCLIVSNKLLPLNGTLFSVR